MLPLEETVIRVAERSRKGSCKNRMTVTACDVNRLLRTAQRKRDSVDGGDRRLRNGASTIAIAALAPNLSQFAGDLRVTL